MFGSESVSGRAATLHEVENLGDVVLIAWAYVLRRRGFVCISSGRSYGRAALP